MKKLIYLFLSIALSAQAAAAQAVGDWQCHNNYSYEVEKVIETSGKVYFVADNNLFHYDKSHDETYGYTRRNGLSDVKVTTIYHNPDANYIMAVYENGNIDLVYPDGSIVNMPDIVAASQLSDKTINDVAFDGDKAYVAAGFGVAVFDTKRHVVIESGIFNRQVKGIAIAGDRLVIATDGILYNAPLGGRINTLDNFTPMGQLDAIDLEGLANDKVMYIDSNRDKCAVITLDFVNNRFSEGRSSFTTVPYLIKSGDKVMVQNYLGGAFYDVDGNMGQSLTTPQSLLTEDYRRYMRRHSMSDDGSMWFLNSDGLGHYRRAADGTVTVDRQAGKPIATSLKGGPGRIVRGDASGLFYLHNLAYSHLPKINHLNDHMSLNVIENGFIDDITPANSAVEFVNPNSQKILKAGYCLAEDPDEAGTIYVGTNFEGIYKIKDGRQVAKYDWTNMPLSQRYMFSCNALSFDLEGNMWVYMKSSNGDDSEFLIAILPSAKRRLSSGVASNDWIVLSPKGFGTTNTMNPTILPLTSAGSRGIVVIADGWDENKMMVYNTSGTGTTTSDDSYRVWSALTDQDGKTFGPTRIASLAEDRDGALWIGTADGIIVAKSPASLLNASATIERVKVPRNDGTSYADYLLSSQLVTSIAVDNANRKWCGTSTSGLYLVSADGREIIENYNKDNSYLPSNEILSVACDPESNLVYIATADGLLTFSSDASPAASDYSEVYAYPNPVRPDYGGWITVTGLMDDSLVKIADAAGNVLFNGRSEGGMVTWDGCNRAGERVKTGVYYVFASQNGDGGSSGAVTKIVVVN